LASPEKDGHEFATGRVTTRAETAQGAPTQSDISPNIPVYEGKYHSRITPYKEVGIWHGVDDELPDGSRLPVEMREAPQPQTLHNCRWHMDR